MSDLRDRIAGAPISWGVCEVPGWGPQLPVGTVLGAMAEIGLKATELGPDGFLPGDPDAMSSVLGSHGLHAVAQFVPLVLHDPEHDPIPELQRALVGILAGGARIAVLAAATGADGYDARPDLDERGLRTLVANLDRASEVSARAGVVAALHPHVGTMVERSEEVDQVLAGSSIGLCLDTGHLLIGGADPVALAQQHPGRISHVHLKDVAAGVVQRVRTGEITYYEGVLAGMYTPLGEGDLDLPAIVAALEGAGYTGWYVLEQDVVVEGDEPHRATADVRAAMHRLAAVAAQVDTAVGEVRA